MSDPIPGEAARMDRREGTRKRSIRGRLLSGLAAMLVPCALAATSPQRPGQPADIGLVEKAGTHLAQIEVTVFGDRQAIDQLGPSDFRVTVLRRRMENLFVDRVCQSPAPPGTRAGESGEGEISVRAAPATYLFYFDQPHLTMTGRQRALDLARALVPRLITGGNRGMVVSSAKDLTTFAGLTADPVKLLAALDRLEDDRAQWDPYSELEERRVQEVLGILDDPLGGLGAAVARAREYQAEEIWQMEKSMSRLTMVMGALDEVDSPKGIVFFSDTMRAKPGAHWVELFGANAFDTGYSGLIDSEAGMASMTFDRTLNEASAHAIRLYTVEARGLASLASQTGVATMGAGDLTDPIAEAIPSTIRVRAAQDTLVSMAAESGGRAFLNGVPGAKIAGRISEDLACIFVISFDPLGLPEDQPLPIKVTILKSGLTAQARGRLVVQSESARLTSKLLAAFAAPEAITRDASIRASVIPTGFSDGRFSALVQVAVPGSPFPNASWDIGASLVSLDNIRDATSARLGVGTPGTPVVLEREMTFSPGPYEIVAVAHESSTDQITSRRIDSAWPDLRVGRASVGPIAVLQPAAGAFHRNGVTQTRGSLALSEADLLHPDRAAALVTVVCRGKEQTRPLRVERKLTGASTVEFPPIEMDGGDPCAQVRDLIPAGRMGPGEFHYAIRVIDGKEGVASAERRFVVAPPAASRADKAAGS